MNDRLQSQLKQLRLSGLATTLQIRFDRGRHGNEAFAEAVGGIPVRDHHAALRNTFDNHDEQSAIAGLGQTDR